MLKFVRSFFRQTVKQHFLSPIETCDQHAAVYQRLARGSTFQEATAQLQQ
jgi:hypothetical protein